MVTKYGISIVNGCSSLNDTSNFYSNKQVKTDFVSRLGDIVNHVNHHFGKRGALL